MSFILPLLLAMSHAAPPARPVVLSPLQSAQQTFSGTLYRRVAAREEGNLLLSPASAQLALGMTVAGARGQTRTQMLTALSLPDSATLHADLGALLRAWNNPGDVDLSVVNRVWVEQSMPLTPAYAQLLERDYAGGVEGVDFIGHSEPARVQINAWVAERTHDRVPALLNPGIIDDQTRMVLTNAVYFLGKWAMPFESAGTHDGSFRRADGGVVQVSLMSQRGTFEYAQVDGVQVLQMPYEGDRFSLVVLLPQAAQPLDAVERALGPEVFSVWLPRLRSSTVDVVLPRFRFEGGADFSGAIDDLGMPLAFSDDADFTGMTTADALKIKAVIHKTFIQVDEDGTEAAAATAVVMVTRGVSIQRPEAVRFRADHPFVFFIWDAQTRTPLFVGRVLDPTAR